ncbi:Ditrans,polycis-undecaprenyl-diphosphate synthase ((2E,6E)-farnesyl-diphosphate specific) [bacterium HR23]|nr:Ditrans,polycis-undecaprenyl-diphosphate synthase ((2E,6E)-farnesyl-diphosphate specific) [bacterium HR23]
MQTQVKPFSTPPTDGHHPIPLHVAIIMDGNGRWASQRNLPRLEGHRAGTENVRRVVQAFARWGVRYLTLYAFSTENWSRPKEEVQGLLDLLEATIQREGKALHKEKVRIRHLGRLDRLPPSLQQAIHEVLALTRHNEGLTLSVALDYGGRDEIVSAVRRILQDGIPPERVDEVLFARYLYTADLPDPDLIIRTAAEQRLSNFLLWQSAYSEFYFTPTYWPDFNEEEVERALTAFAQRQRRYGGLPTAPNGAPHP